MKKQVFRKQGLARFLNFLFLLPFVLAYRPLLVRYHRSEMIWFSVGTLLVLVIIVISNRRPYVTVDGENLILNLHYYQNPEIHSIERITLVEKISGHSCRIHSRDYKPVRISLNHGDMKRLFQAFSERNITIRTL